MPFNRSHAEALGRVFKADAGTADLSSGGLLLDDIAADFMEYPLKKSVLLSEVRVEPMASHTKRLPKMIAPSQVAHPGVEGVALPVIDRSKVTFDEVLLETNEIISEQRFPWGFLEDSIREGRLKDNIGNYLGRVFRRDLENLGINGDTASANDLLQTQDGWIKRFTTHVRSNASAIANKATFASAIREMDEEFIEDTADMRHYMGVHGRHRYIEQIADRQTGLGDEYFTGRAVVTGSGVAIVGVPFFPSVAGAGTNETTILTTRPDNLLMGIWKQVRIHFAVDTTARKDIVLTRTRAGFNIEWNEGCTKTTAVLGKN